MWGLMTEINLDTLIKMCRAWHMNNGETGLRVFLYDKTNFLESGIIYVGWEDSLEYQEWVIEKSLHKAIIRWGEPFYEWLIEKTE